MRSRQYKFVNNEFSLSREEEGAATRVGSNNHGCYLLTTQGCVLANGKQARRTTMRFAKDDIINCRFDPFKKILIFGKNNINQKESEKEEEEISVEFEPIFLNKLYPCFIMSNPQDSLQLLWTIFLQQKPETSHSHNKQAREWERYVNEWVQQAGVVKSWRRWYIRQINGVCACERVSVFREFKLQEIWVILIACSATCGLWLKVRLPTAATKVEWVAILLLIIVGSAISRLVRSLSESSCVWGIEFCSRRKVIIWASSISIASKFDRELLVSRWE